MDRFMLCRALRAAGVPSGYYEIPDCPGEHRAADRYFMEEHDGEWLVGVHERGRRDVFERFTDETRACEWLYDRLVDEAPAPEPDRPHGTAG
ncbi:hypothetical protein [Streptomyces sp. NPDC088736]|uniref:hypothetical protein n=1 Tax=Streptomyces sp. NPDC088736 TaxID=3365881 RepID=UPI003801F422